MAYEEVTINTNWWKPEQGDSIEAIIIENNAQDSVCVVEVIGTSDQMNLPNHTALTPLIAKLEVGTRVRITRTEDKKSATGRFYHTYRVEKWTEAVA